MSDYQIYEASVVSAYKRKYEVSFAEATQIVSQSCNTVDFCYKAQKPSTECARIIHTQIR